MTKINYSATFANGQTYTRKSERTYTHAWRVTFGDNQEKVGFNASRELARAGAHQFARCSNFSFEIVPVQISEPAPRKARAPKAKPAPEAAPAAPAEDPAPEPEAPAAAPEITNTETNTASGYPTPFQFAIEPGRPLLVMSCSATKVETAAGELVRFAELYDGPTWRQVRASAFPLSSVAAISALYGFLEPGMAIETYDRVMDEKIAQRQCSTSNHVWRLEQAIRQAGSAFIVGGALYRQMAEAVLRAAPDLADKVTFATGSYLQQRKQLGAWLRRQAIAGELAAVDQVETAIAEAYAPELEAAAPIAAAPAQKPELCYVAIQSRAPGKRIGIIKRGEAGYYETRDLDRREYSIAQVGELVDELNRRLGVDRLEARAMHCGSLFGWNVPAANSDHAREAIAEADAIAAARS